VLLRARIVSGRHDVSSGLDELLAELFAVAMLVAANRTRFEALARLEKGHVSIGHLSHANPPKVIQTNR
jgi:hypothetical protein